MKHVVGLTLTVLVLALLSGCETWRGFGKDMQKAGRSIERHAEH